MSNDENMLLPQLVDICENIKAKNVDYSKLCKNIHMYIKNFSIEGPKAQWDQMVLLQVFKDVQPVLKADSTSIQLKKPIVIFGPIFGEGDSLINLMSVSGTLPDVNYIMLGCYLGNGFAPIECLIFVLCLKILHPSSVFLLKGHLEESIAIEMLNVQKWLGNRGVCPGEILEMITNEMKRACSLMLPALFVNSKFVCMPGGPGPMIRQKGLQKLLAVPRPPVTIADKKMLMESAWSVMILREDQRNLHGMPSFSESECSKFCEKNGIGCIVRGRQMVEDGYLNKPIEMITLMSAVAYLDNFKNQAAVLKINDEKATIIRYKMEEIEQTSLELVKPGLGRNTQF